MTLEVVECTNSEFVLEKTKIEFYRTFTKEPKTPILCKVDAKIPYSFGDDRWYTSKWTPELDWNQAYVLRDELQKQFPFPRRFAVRCF